jgi:hypothetical protein
MKRSVWISTVAAAVLLGVFVYAVRDLSRTMSEG